MRRNPALPQSLDKLLLLIQLVGSQRDSLRARRGGGPSPLVQHGQGRLPLRRRTRLRGTGRHHQPMTILDDHMPQLSGACDHRESSWAGGGGLCHAVEYDGGAGGGLGHVGREGSGHHRAGPEANHAGSRQVVSGAEVYRGTAATRDCAACGGIRKSFDLLAQLFKRGRTQRSGVRHQPEETQTGGDGIWLGQTGQHHAQVQAAGGGADRLVVSPVSDGQQSGAHGEAEQANSGAVSAGSSVSAGSKEARPRLKMRCRIAAQPQKNDQGEKHATKLSDLFSSLFSRAVTRAWEVGLQPLRELALRLKTEVPQWLKPS